MRCDEVIRELAAPTGGQRSTALSEHLASCPGCALWARRAEQLDELWEATHPAEPSPEAWGSVWASISRSLTSIEAGRSDSPRSLHLSRNGIASQSTAFTGSTPLPSASSSR